MRLDLSFVKKAIEKKLKTNVTEHHFKSALRTLKLEKAEGFSETDVSMLAKVVVFKMCNPNKRWKPEDSESRSKLRAEKKEYKIKLKSSPIQREDGWVLGRRLEEYLLLRYGTTPSLIHLRKLYDKFSINMYVNPMIAVEYTRDLWDIAVAQTISSSCRANTHAPSGYIWGKDLEDQCKKLGSTKCLSTIKSRLLEREIYSRRFSLIPLKVLKEVIKQDDYTYVPKVQFEDFEETEPTRDIYQFFVKKYREHGRVLNQQIWRSSCLSALKIKTKISQKVPKELTCKQVYEIQAEIEKRFAKQP